MHPIGYVRVIRNVTLFIVVAAVALAGLVAALAVRAGVAAPVSSDELFRPGAPGTGQAFVNSRGQVVKLNGFDQQPIWSGGLTSSASLERLRQAKDAGFNSMRYILFWNLMEPTRGSFAHLAELDRAVANAKAAGIYIVLEMIDASQDAEHIPAWARTGADTIADITAHAKGYVQALTRRYAHEPNVVAYDPVNEPRQSTANNTRDLRMYQRILGWIRPLDADKIVQIEPTWGATSLGSGCADWSVLTSRANTELQVHDYYGGGGTGGIGWNGCVNDGVEMWKSRASYRSSVPSQLDAHLKRYLSDGADAGLPVYVGEYSDKAGATGHDRWIRDTVSVLNKHGLSRAWWQYHTIDPNSATEVETWRWFPWVPLLRSGTTAAPPTSTPTERVLPNATVTPGAYDAAVRQRTVDKTICARGWARRVRPPASYLNALKLEQMAQYGETGPPSAYVEDHLIPLELGGAPRNRKNLWPEPRSEAKQSRRLEVELQSRLCRGAITLARARATIRAFKFANG